MKKLLTTLFIVYTGFARAQEPFSEYGQIKPEEIAMKQCAFDTEADAVILVHEAVADHDPQYKLITHHRVRIKILKDAGAGHADVKIPYYSKDNFEWLNFIKGRVYNLNSGGGIDYAELDRKTIFKKNINKYYSEMSFAFPQVKAGSIIEYEWESTMENYGGLDDWQFQDYLPVVKSSYSVVIIPNYEFAYRLQKRQDYPVTIKPDKNNGRIYFEMNNIPGLQNEPFMDSRKDYLQRVTFQLAGHTGYFSRSYSKNWVDMVRELNQNPNFGGQIGKNLAGSEELIALVKTDPSLANRLNRVYNYVRKNISWNGFSGIFSSDGLKSAWSKKSGHSGEVNLILVNLLKDAGIDANPILISQRSHGRVNKEIPFLEQFNTVYAYAVIDGRKYYLNALESFNPASIIPNDILNTTGLIVSRRGGGLVEITDDQFEYKDFISVMGKLRDDGTMEGEVFMNSSDYARGTRLASYHHNPRKYFESITGVTDKIAVDSFQVLNEENDTLPLQHKFRYQAIPNKSGDYTLIPTYMFSDLKDNPFISNMRFSNINFGYRRNINMNFILEIPEGITPDELPKSVRMANPDKSIIFGRMVNFDAKSRRLVSRITITTTKSLYEAAEYPVVQEFYKKMYDYLSEQIVIRKS